MSSTESEALRQAWVEIEYLREKLTEARRIIAEDDLLVAKCCMNCKDKDDCPILRFILSYPKVCEPPPYDGNWHCSDWRPR